ncbi:MAG TPA: NAD(P)H-binding protein [Pseudonocardiaceae bacterium]
MSTITVIGGTGFTGSRIVREAAARGHQVSALSRHAPAEPVSGVRYVQGTWEQAGDLVSGADVVVVALSPRGNDTAGTVRHAYAEIGSRAAAAGARFIVIGGFSTLRPAPGAPRFTDSGEIPAEFAAEASEMYDVLSDLQDAPAGLDWLYVSPAAEYGVQVPGKRVGSYRVGDDVALFDANGKSALSGDDFATAVVDEIETAKHHRAHISIAY